MSLVPYSITIEVNVERMHELLLRCEQQLALVGSSGDVDTVECQQLALELAPLVSQFEVVLEQGRLEVAKRERASAN